VPTTAVAPASDAPPEDKAIAEPDQDHDPPRKGPAVREVKKVGPDGGAPVKKRCQWDWECLDNQVCVPARHCAKAGNPGWCQDRPTGCPTTGYAVCGCDGRMYYGECEARAHGVDVVAGHDCFPDPGHDP
jgi:hypothetical protein